MSEVETFNIEEVQNMAFSNRTIVSAMIEVTKKCNWNCIHCYIPEHNIYGLTKEDIISIGKQLRDMGVFEITLTGGEIFCRVDILDIIYELRNMFFSVKINSNISLLNEDIIIKLKNLNIKEISCSIYSLNEKIHDNITRSNNSLKRTITNLMLLKKHNISVIIKTMILKENKNEFLKIKEYCDQYGFEFMVDNALIGQTDGCMKPKEFELDENELNDVIEKIDFINGWVKQQIDLNRAICPEARISIVILSNGDITSCIFMNEVIGNIYNNSIDEIWNNSGRLKYIQQLKWKDLNDCKFCDAKNYCRRCSGNALTDDGNILGKSISACKEAKLRYKNYKLEVR